MSNEILSLMNSAYLCHRIRRDRSTTSAEVIQNHCLQAQNSMVEQTNAREKLPNLQAAAEKDEDSTHNIELLTLEKRNFRPQGLALMIRRDTPITRFQNSVQASLRAIDDPSERRAVVLHSSVKWLRDLLDEWTTLAHEGLETTFPASQASDEQPVRNVSGSSNTHSRSQQDSRAPQRRSSSFDNAKKVQPPGSKASPERFGYNTSSSSLDGQLDEDELLAFEWVEPVFQNLPATKILTSEEARDKKLYFDP